MMNESVYNAVIDALVDEFGKDVVLSTKFDYTFENGINVVPTLSSDESHFSDNIHARYVLKSVIGEAENPDVEVIKGKQNLYFHNKKTGYGYFIHFD